MGEPDCFRDQLAVLIPEAEHNEVLRKADRKRGVKTFKGPSGLEVNESAVRGAALRRGGVTPFNCLAMGTQNRRMTHGHSASTPERLCDWWLRYICPPGGTVCDPFIGSGTVGIAAVKSGRSVVGVERMPKYHATAERRIEAELAAREWQLIPA